MRKGAEGGPLGPAAPAAHGRWSWGWGADCLFSCLPAPACRRRLGGRTTLTRRARLTGAPDRSPQLGQLPWPVALVCGMPQEMLLAAGAGASAHLAAASQLTAPFLLLLCFPTQHVSDDFLAPQVPPALAFILWLPAPFVACPAGPSAEQSGVSFNVKHSQLSRNRGFGGVAVWLQGIEATRPQLAALLAPVPNGSPSNCVSDVVHTSGQRQHCNCGRTLVGREGRHERRAVRDTG